MTFLLSFIAGILIGVLFSGTNDSFIDSLRKWFNESTKDNEKKRAELEDTIEKNLPDFRQWIKQEAERKRKLKRKLLLYYLLVLTLMLFFQIMQLISGEHKQLASIFQFNNKQQSAPEKESTTPESAVKATNR